MIFVTVGLHTQPFDRLISKVDSLIEEQIIQEKVVMQIGFSNYEPKNCKYSKMYTNNEIEQFVKEARIVITHGGPSSFVIPLKLGKVPIVVPRQVEYNEHINDHQIEFTQAIEERMNNIIVVKEISDLKKCILNYEELIKNKNGGIKSHNREFCEKFESMVMKLFLQ